MGFGSCQQDFLVLAKGLSPPSAHFCDDCCCLFRKGDWSAKCCSHGVVWFTRHLFPPNGKGASPGGRAEKDGCFRGMDVQPILGKLFFKRVEHLLEVVTVLAPQVGIVKEGSPGTGGWGSLLLVLRSCVDGFPEVSGNNGSK